MTKLTFTGRIATFSFRHKWYVVAAWLVLLVAAGVASSGLSSALTTEMRDLTGSESRQATDLIDERFGKQPLVENLIIRSEGATVDDPEYRSLVDRLATHLRGAKGVTQVITPFEAGDGSLISTDRHASITRVLLGDDEERAEKDVVGVLAVVEAVERPAGYSLDVTGTASINHEFNAISEKDIQRGERLGVPIALVEMVIAFGTLVAAGVPLLLGFAAILPAIGSVALIGQAYELDFNVTSIISMLGLAVGIDYSMFIIGRYREELDRGHARLEAMAIAADSSGRAAFFSGLTVLLALAGMLLVRNSIFVSIGIGAMVVVLYAIIASLTLLPALLGIIGGAINRLRVPWLGKTGYGVRFWNVVTRAVQRRPVVFAAASAALLIAAALPLTTINLGANGVESLPEETASYRAITALQRDFPGGLSEPLKVVVEGDLNSGAVQSAISRLQMAVAARTDLQWLGITPAAGGRTAVIELASTEIGTGDDAQRVVRDLRNDVIPAAFDGSGATVLVGGGTPMFVDMKVEMDRRTLLVFGFVLSLSFILLLMVFRSIAIPIKAIIMNLLSVGAAYGLLVAVFQHGFLADFFGFQQTEQIEFWLPLFLFSILFGLSMDYHVFLLSRVKEEYSRTGDNTLAVTTGVRSTAGMITSAAVIMVAVFSGFAMGEMVGLQQLGFGLAVAVFLDATVIRSVLVPASMQLLGKYNWWMPSWLNWLPELHVEGARPALALAPALAGISGDD